MTLLQTTDSPRKANSPTRKRKRKTRTKADVPGAKALADIDTDTTVHPNETFAWGAAAIGRVINRNAKQTFHIMPDLEEAGVVRKFNGLWVGNVSKLRDLFGG